MILKFVFYPENESETVSERVVQCDEFYQSYTEKGKRAKFEFNDSRDFDAKTFIDDMDVSCKTTAVYIMSDQGKTIDSYKWKEDDRGITHRN